MKRVIKPNMHSNLFSQNVPGVIGAMPKFVTPAQLAQLCPHCAGSNVQIDDDDGGATGALVGAVGARVAAVGWKVGEAVGARDGGVPSGAAVVGAGVGAGVGETGGKLRVTGALKGSQTAGSVGTKSKVETMV